MERTHRRKLLATTGTGLAALGAGCLGGFGDEDDESDDAESPTEDGDSTGTATPLERWVPTSGSEELLFHYRDLTALETYEDALQASVIEAVPTLPDGDSAAVIEDAADGTNAIDSVLRFGSEGVVGNVVVSGSFDPDALETDGGSSVGEFETLERDDVSVAVSEATIVVSPADGADLEAILAAGVEGTDRRIEASENFASLVDRVTDTTFLWGQYAETEGAGRAFSWAVDAETTTYREVGVYADAEVADGFESRLATEDDVTIEIDDDVAVATGSFPTEKYEYFDMFAERGSSRPATPRAGVTFDPDYADRTVTVTYTSKERAERLEISDDHGNSGEMTAAGETTVFEYESGASGEITVVAVWDGEEAVVATYSYSF
ncbi:hypothetical protein C478_05824 [Natrinema thermotolerans DSM 11552]|nr:hypothetical protein C478_05824 [Natrinema thermotolerans DSM 11552]